ncbi:sorbosone dehydrogenase family protein, partial [Escherichia coli]|nr:sorbosone dehydrogenase family protein [Escherichia coli]
MPRTNLAGVSMSVVILVAIGVTRSGAEPVLKGTEAFGDWQRDKPGVVRLITPQDLPKPGATASSSNSSRVVPRPASA